MKTAPSSPLDKPQPKSGPRTIVLALLAMVFIIPAGYGFSVRFMSFFRTLQADEQARFTIVPMLNYLAVAGGFICLFIWAVFRGMFRDIERPKYTMLENEEKLDRGEPIVRSV